MIIRGDGWAVLLRRLVVLLPLLHNCGGMYQGLKLAKEKRLSNIVLQTDSKAVMQSITSTSMGCVF